MTYYNDNDPKVCAWLRELIKEGIIPPGEVDERSILDVMPHEIARYSQQHFFAGIGGWAFALRLAGWPDDKPVKTGSCPCQPFSIAGKGRAEKDERHLWPAFRDLIAFGEPTITFGEQVASPLGREWLSGVRADLENLGYEVGAADLCAAGVGAPHRRQRLFWVANPYEWRRHSWSGTESQVEKSKSWYGEPEQRSGIGTRRMVLANGAGRDERPITAKASGHRSPVESASSVVGLADMQGEGRSRVESEQPEGFEQRSRLGGDSSTLGLSDADRARLQERTAKRNRADAFAESLPPNPWSDYGILPFRDGKFRRVEAGTFPLAVGVPHRVGLLRGYGNAICPQIAEEFIRAAIEALV